MQRRGGGLDLRGTTGTHASVVGESLEVDFDLVLGMFDAGGEEGFVGHGGLCNLGRHGGEIRRVLDRVKVRVLLCEL
jgi:hypothetical protein